MPAIRAVVFFKAMTLANATGAGRRLTEDIKERRPEIPWPKVAGIGNVLRHAYDQVAPDVLWKLGRLGGIRQSLFRST